MTKFERRIERIILDLEDVREDCQTLNDQEPIDECINKLRYSTIHGRTELRQKAGEQQMNITEDEPDYFDRIIPLHKVGDIVTWLDCPDLGQLCKEQCYYHHLIHGGTCKIRRDSHECERSFR